MWGREADRKFNVKAFALTCGLVWGLGLFCVTWWMIAFDGPAGEVTFIGRMYRDYSISPSGSLVGLMCAFFDGLIGGAIFAWLYNFVVLHNERSFRGTAALRWAKARASLELETRVVRIVRASCLSRRKAFLSSVINRRYA